MNCPRCGERMYGSVCPRCGNVVVNNNRQRKTTNLSSRINRDEIRFMDGSGARKVKPKAKKATLNPNIYKIAIVVMAVIAAFFYFKYSSANSKLQEAQTTITSLNDSITAKDAEIAQLKADQTAQQNQTDGSSNNSDAPMVEFDENGNLVNIENNSSSNSNNDSNSEGSQSDYQSGDTYVIKDGDTGMDICRTIYGEYTAELWEKLLAANDMTTSSQYHPGDELVIP